MRKILAALAAVALLATGCSSTFDNSSSSSNDAVTIQDVDGRTVKLDHKPERVVLGEGRALMALATLNKDNPTENVVAIANDAKKQSPSFWKKITEAKPDINKIPDMGSILSGDTTVEKIVSYNPDLLIIPIDVKTRAKVAGYTDKLDQAGVKYAFIDFRSDPAKNTKASMTTLGQIFGYEDKAKEYNDFYDAMEKKVTDAVSGKEQVTSFLWRAAGLKDCCATVGDWNLGEFIPTAGGKNLGQQVFGDKQSGDLAPEKVLELNPNVVIATGGEWAKEPGKTYQVPNAEVGYGTSEDTAKATRDGACSGPRALTLSRLVRTGTSTPSGISSTQARGTFSLSSSLLSECTLMR